MQEFWKAIDQITPLTEKGKSLLLDICKQRSVAKNEFILNRSSVCNGIYFIKEGLARIYYYKHGKEITEWFALDKTFCFSILSFFRKVPSQLIIQCIEDTEVVTISRDGLIKLSDESLEIARLFREMLSGSLIMSQLRMDAIQFETAKQRYENLIKLYPSIIQRVPLQYIASYLGISAETISRIRAHPD